MVSSSLLPYRVHIEIHPCYGELKNNTTAMQDAPPREAKSSIRLDQARWLVWPVQQESGIRALTSEAQFVHQNQPVLAVQDDDSMKYFGPEGKVKWRSNRRWPRANLVMARLPGRGTLDPGTDDRPM